MLLQGANEGRQSILRYMSAGLGGRVQCARVPNHRFLDTRVHLARRNKE